MGIGAYWKFQTNMLFHFQRKPGAFAHGIHGRIRKFFSSVAKQRIFREIQYIPPARLNLFHSTGVDSLFCPEGQVAGHWDCPSLGANSRYMLLPCPSSNFGKSKCELRGLSRLWLRTLFLLLGLRARPALEIIVPGEPVPVPQSKNYY